MKDNMQEELNKKQKKQAEKKRKRQEFIEELARHCGIYLYIFAITILLFSFASTKLVLEGKFQWVDVIWTVIIVAIILLLAFYGYIKLIVWLKSQGKNNKVFSFFGNNLGYILYFILTLVICWNMNGMDFSKESAIKAIELTWAVQAITIGIFVSNFLAIIKIFGRKKSKILNEIRAVGFEQGQKRMLDYNSALRGQNWCILYALLSIIVSLAGTYYVMFKSEDIENYRYMQNIIFSAGYTTLNSLLLLSCTTLMIVLLDNKKMFITQEDIEKLTASDKVLQEAEDAKQDNLPADAQEAAASVDDSKKKQEKADEVDEIKEDEKEKTEETKEESKEETKEEKEGKDGKKK